MKKLFVLVLVMLVSMVPVSNAENDFAVRLGGINDATIIGEYMKDGMYYYLVEKNDWTWVVSSHLDVVTGVEGYGWKWNSDTMELSFQEDDGSMVQVVYPYNFDQTQTLFNLTNPGGWAKYWN